MPVPSAGYAEDTGASPTCLVNFERNRYSVDCRYGQSGRHRARLRRAHLLMHGEEMIGDHPRFFGRGHVQYNPWHYVPALSVNPARFATARPSKTEFTRRHDAPARAARSAPDGDRPVRGGAHMVALYGLDAVTEACAVALNEQVATSAHV